MDGSDQDAASTVFESDMLNFHGEVQTTAYRNHSRLVNAEQAAVSESGGEERLEQQEEYLDGELEEPDGQRSSVSLDEDGGTHFEVSQLQESTIRRGCPPSVPLPETNRDCDSPLGPDMPGDNDGMFDPVQRLNFDDDDDDEEDNEDVDNGNEEGEYSPGSATESYDPVDSELQQRPDVNGSEQGESSRSSGFRSLQDHSQNVRIIEGHDSSFLDDAPQQVQQPASYGFNFLHTQMIQLPSLSGMNVSGLANNGGSSPGGFPSNHHRLLSEEEQAHNLYDSLEREDGSSLFGEGSHNHAGGENLDDLQQYFNSGGGGAPMSLLAANTVGSQHQLHNHQQHGDNDAFWEHDDSSDHGSYLSNSHAHHGTSDQTGSPQHGRHQSPPRNFQVELCAAHTIPPADSVFLPSGRQGDGFNSPLEGDSGSPVEDDFQEDNTHDALSAELSEEGLLQDTQMYAQPVTSASSLNNPGAVQRDSAISNLLHTYNPGQRSGTFNLSQTANGRARQQTDNSGSQQPPPKNLAWSQAQPVVELSAEGAGTFNGLTQGDRRQAGAGSSMDNKDLPQAAALNVSGGAIPKKPQSQVARTQQKRRPAVQGSASSNDTQRSTGVGPRAMSQPSGRKTAANGAALNHRAGQKQGAGQRMTSAPEVGRGALPGASDATSPSHQLRQLQGKVTTGSPLTSRANSHTSLASSAGSTNSRVSGVGKESHRARSQKVHPGAQMPSSTLQEGIQPSLNAANKLHGTATSASQAMTSGSSMAALPRKNRDSSRPNPANQQESTRSRVFGKPRTLESEREESSQSLMSAHAGNVQMSGSVSQQGKSHGLPDQTEGGHSSQNLDSTGGGNPVSKQSHRYIHSNPQRHGQGLRQQSLQRNLASLSIQGSGVSPPGSDGALPAGASPSGSEGSHRSGGRESVMSQMEALRKQGHRLSPSEFQPSQVSHPGSDVQGMEDVRHHLQNILSLGSGSFTGADQHVETGSDLLMAEQPVNRELNFDTDSSSFVGPSGPGDMSEILENFPTFSSKMFSNVPASSSWLDTSGHSGNSQSQQMRTQQLRDSLEKEMYRRKHCEEHIQKLNTKLLEVQQQLAVAVSTDKRKDIMIEQLDKQLARVVEGWKKREAEKDEFLKTLTHEKGQIEETLLSQQAMINNFEAELAQTVDELKKEKERSAQTIRHLKEDIYEAERAKESAVDQLESERDKYQMVAEEWESLKESKATLEQTAQQAQEKLEQEQERWSIKEQELNSKITEVKEATQKVINIEKVKTEEMKKKKEAAELEGTDLKAELKKAVLDMEQLLREKESQKVEMSIMEAKFESAQRKLEADLHSQMEKEIADQASEFHARLDSTVEEMSERHRRQVGELHQRQQRDLAQQATAINDQRDKKDEEFRHQIADLEEKLQDMRTENSALRQSKLKLESQRMEILTKLQLMMQSQWNEAVSLLVNTPQKKSLNSSFLSSSQSGSQLASALAVTDGNASVTSLNLLASSVNGVGVVARSGGGDGQSAPLQPFGKKASSPQPRPPEATSDTDKGRGSSRAKVQAEEDAHAQLDRMGRVEDYLERLSQHMEIPMTRNDLHRTLSDGNTASVSSTTTNTTIASNNSSGNMSAQQQHDFRRPVAYSHSVTANDSGDQRDPQYQVKSRSAASSPSQRSRSVEETTQVHGFVTGQAGERIITTGAPQHDHTRQAPQRAGGEQRLQAVAMRSPQQSSSWPNPVQGAGPDFQASWSSTSYQQESRDPHKHSSNFQLQQHPHHDHKHNHQHLGPHFQDEWDSGHIPGAGNSSALPNSQRHSHNHHFHPTGFSSSTSPRAQKQQHQEQTTPPRLQQQNRHFSKSPKERRTASNINIYTPGSPTYMSSPERYNNSSDQWSPAGHPGLGHPSMVLSGAAAAPEDERSHHRKPSQRQFSNIRHTGQLNESLSPPVKQTAERDHTDSASEASSSFHDPARLQANYSQLSEKLEEHQSRQGELQHYVRMLLSKAPGSVCSEPERDAAMEPSILESSRDLTVDLDLNDTATAREVTSQLSRLQELREKEQALRGHRENGAQASQSRSDQVIADQSQTSLFDDNGVISAQGLSEISQLLLMYREQWETNPEAADQGNVAGQLMEALRGMTTAVSPERAKVKMDPKKSTEAKVSPKSQRTRKMKKMLNGSQSSGDVSLSTNPETSQLDRSAAGRGGSGASAVSTKRKVAGSNRGLTTTTSAGPSSTQHQHGPHSSHSHHVGEGPGRDRKFGAVGSGSQGKTSGAGAKSAGGSSGPVWK